MELNEKIKARQSVRKFNSTAVSDDLIREILDVARWAPSGLNNQPWKFIIVKDTSIKEQLAKQTHYSGTIQNAPICIAVFYDKAEGYNYVKDVQGIGASIQNMLLAIYNLGLGGVWLGEILNKRAEVERILEVPENFELMAVIALGYPAKEKKETRSRKSLSELTYLNKYGSKLENI
ncbi:MAG TPA: nitroreductase family protein [Candidatus Deferrimicrobium sp.]|nr:nitroreductase family protein [Candidatus Deferrimicrobium sp.]